MIQALILLTIGLPWLGGLVVWLTTNKRPRAQHTFAVAFAVAAGFAALLMLPYTSAAPAIVIPLGGIFGALTFTPDGMGVFLAIIARNTLMPSGVKVSAPKMPPSGITIAGVPAV
jgi:hypothetical protein